MQRSTEQPDSSAPSQPQILVVDDVIEILEITSEILGEAGYAVITAESGKVALEELRKRAFDLVLTDIEMPDATGVDILRAVRERDLDTPVILITGNPRVETAVQALELGALRYLVKPVQSRQLLDAVQHGVRLHQLARLKREALAAIGDSGRLVSDRAGLESVFSRGLSGLWLAYQPILRADDGKLYGQEALLRTSEPAIPHPGAFLDAAERLGRVLDLGRAVRSIAARDLSGFDSQTLFVNLHPLDLGDAELLAEEAPLAPHAPRVVLEITERASLDGIGDLRGSTARLRQLGFRIAIDDLGSGYSGLTAFAALEPDLVKLDMGLVRGVDRQPLRRKLIRSIAELCRGLGILVLAEGVETEAEREALTEAGCDLLQGFLFGRPAPPAPRPS